MSPVAIALGRFGLGARPGDPVPRNPRRWLLDQFTHYDPAPPSIAAAPGSVQVTQDQVDFNRDTAVLKAAAPMVLASPDAPGGVLTPDQTAIRARLKTFERLEKRARFDVQVAARITQALTTPAPLVERLVAFWSNHFATSVDKLMIGYGGTLEAEAIRPHVLGRFADMLAAVERHPAMLLYLDQGNSVGPNSPYALDVARRGKVPPGLNENLAREILELHTLGAHGGYTQADVTEFARALTGRSVAGGGKGQGSSQGMALAPVGRFVFVPALHEPGGRTILGTRYAAGGEGQAQSVLDALALHPATATHLATKLARHFAGDAPPAAMVGRLAAAFAHSGGDLPTVYRAIVASDEAWVPQSVKFRTPWEWAIAIGRALGAQALPPAAIAGMLAPLGQPIWRPGQPSGWDDIAAGWAGPNALMRRIDAAAVIAAQHDAVDVRALAAALFPGSVSADTQRVLAGAESPSQALALLLVAPEMLRR